MPVSFPAREESIPQTEDFQVNHLPPGRTERSSISAAEAAPWRHRPNDNVRSATVRALPDWERARPVGSQLSLMEPRPGRVWGVVRNKRPVGRAGSRRPRCARERYSRLLPGWKPAPDDCAIPGLSDSAPPGVQNQSKTLLHPAWETHPECLC